MRQALRFLTATRCVFTLLLAGVISGCALPAHNNTLVFAVNRKIGLDINPTNATNAGLTIGYSSTEFAYVPLWANGPDGKPFAECQKPLQYIKTDTGKTPIPCVRKPKFQGQDAEGKGNGDDDDAYSVFASFGGRAGGGTQSGDVNGNLQVASFFATGIAAQNLAERADGKMLVGLDTEKKKAAKNNASTKAVYAFLGAVESNAQKTESLCLKTLQAEFRGIAKSDLDFDAVKNLPTQTAAKLLVEIVKDESADGVKRLNLAADLLRARYENKLEEEQAASKNKAIYGEKVVADEVRKKICLLKVASTS
jgi:hypothetical protein